MTKAAKGMPYAVTRRSRKGEEVVTVQAESGDDAAAKAAKDGCVVVGVHPA
jgi:hypothetical protein